MPYHKLAGAYATPDARSATKHLVFSSWHVVPKTVAAILSREAEREMIRARRPKAEISEEEWREQSRLLHFNLSGGKPASMPLLLFVYPTGAPPTFFGHYAQKTARPAPIRGNLACLDYGTGKGGFLCAYRWDGESEIAPGKFVMSRAAENPPNHETSKIPVNRGGAAAYEHNGE